MSRSVAGDTYEHHVGHESRKRENLLSLVEAIDPQSYLEIGAQPTAASSNRPAPALVVLIKAVLSVALRTRPGSCAHGPAPAKAAVHRIQCWAQ